MSKVIDLGNVTSLDFPPEKILTDAMSEDLKAVFVVGRNKDGNLYFASSMADGGDVLWLMELTRKALLA